MRGLLRLNFIIFPFLWVIVMAFIGLESTTYSGFIGKNLFVDLKLLIIFVFLSGLFARVSLLGGTGVRKVYENYRILSLVNKILFPAILITNLIFIAIEERHFRGYIYTRIFHFDPYYLLIATGLSLFLILLGFDSLITSSLTVSRLKKHKKGRLFLEIFLEAKEIILGGGMMAVIFWILLSNFYYIASHAPRVLHKTFAHLSSSYDWRMREQIGLFYDYTKFINANTPEDALILHPKQQSQWPEISNQGYTRYFIYPRRLVSEDSDEKLKSDIAYIFIIGRKTLDGKNELNQWPEIKVSAKRLIYMPETPSGEATILNKDYDPNDKINDRWGIIELGR